MNDKGSVISSALYEQYLVLSRLTLCAFVVRRLMEARENGDI